MILLTVDYFQPASRSWVVVQVAIQKPGFFEEAGLLGAKLYHYPIVV